MRPSESYLSTNWLEHFHPAERDSQIAGVIATLSRKLDLARTGKIAVLNVGNATGLCRRRAGVSIQFVVLDDVGDPSHTGIFGYSEQTQNARVATLLANSVRPDEVYPAHPGAQPRRGGVV